MKLIILARSSYYLINRDLLQLSCEVPGGVVVHGWWSKYVFDEFHKLLFLHHSLHLESLPAPPSSVAPFPPHLVPNSEMKHWLLCL